MPAHKALNIDNFHDAAVKVGLYKDPVMVFMHPYTLGALETSIRKTGGCLSPDLRYHGAQLDPVEFWSKDDVTFCVVPAAGLKDALARGVVTAEGWQACLQANIAAAFQRCSANDQDPTEAIKLTAQNDIAQRMAEIEAETVNDVTSELEISKAQEQRSAVLGLFR